MSTAPALGNWVGRRIGSYRIQKLIGRGATGSVFLAARDDDDRAPGPEAREHSRHPRRRTEVGEFSEWPNCC
jgi:hypothetical protein